MPEKIVKHGGLLSLLRENPWILSTIVLGVLFIALIFIKSSSLGSSGAVSEQEASQKALAFLNSRVQSGEVTLDSITREKGLYKLTVNYQGQRVPVYLTLDGTSLVADLIPLTSNLTNRTNTIQTSPPSISVVIDQTKIAKAPMKGNVNAQVTIVEFSDFQCPFCEKFYTQTLSQIDDAYIKTGKAKLVYMNFPLSIHNEAEKAAEAGLCAQAQGKFWEMHDKMFENQESLSVVNEKKWARDLGMNGAQFDLCLDSGKYAADIKASFDYGSQLGVTGTPSFFINGVRIEGAYPFETFKQAIDAQIANKL